MKKILVLFLVLFTMQAFAATAVLRQGQYIDQYKIDDPGGDFDNHLLFFSHRVNEIVIQTSSVNYHTSKEALYCWQNSDFTECPDDDIGGGVFRSPAIVLLNQIQLEGGVTVGAYLTDLAEKSIYLAFWFEYRSHKVFQDSVDEMVLEGLNELQQRRSLKYVIFGNGIDLVTSQAVANNWITNGIQPTYNDLNLATMPLQDRRLLKLFGEVGWFE